MAEVVGYDRALHSKRSASYQQRCAQGGIDSCPKDPEFTVRGPAQTIAACPRHLASAVREADRMPARRAG
jgi:hypothetical protein